jgi:hypothetical protein
MMMAYCLRMPPAVTVKSRLHRQEHRCNLSPATVRDIAMQITNDAAVRQISMKVVAVQK